MVPPLVGRRQSLGGVTANVKRLEQDRDAGGPSHRQGGPPWPPTWPSGYCARRGWLSGRIPCAATSAGSRELVRVRCQVPVPAHSYEL